MQDDPSGDLGRAAKLAAAVLLGVVAVDVLAVLFDLLERGVLNDAAAGHMNASAASASDSRQRSMGIAQLILVIAAAVTFLHWFRIAYANLASLGVRDLRYRPGWSVGAWFVPILNVFRPKQIANDIWRASDPAAEPRQGWRERPVAPLLHWWWAIWLLSSIVERLGSRVGGRRFGRERAAGGKRGRHRGAGTARHRRPLGNHRRAPHDRTATGSARGRSDQPAASSSRSDAARGAWARMKATPARQ